MIPALGTNLRRLPTEKPPLAIGYLVDRLGPMDEEKPATTAERIPIFLLCPRLVFLLQGATSFEIHCSVASSDSCLAFGRGSQ